MPPVSNARKHFCISTTEKAYHVEADQVEPSNSGILLIAYSGDQKKYFVMSNVVMWEEVDPPPQPDRTRPALRPDRTVAPRLD
jgi:hypothetical protein